MHCLWNHMRMWLAKSPWCAELTTSTPNLSPSMWCPQLQVSLQRILTIIYIYIYLFIDLFTYTTDPSYIVSFKTFNHHSSLSSRFSVFLCPVRRRPGNGHPSAGAPGVSHDCGVDLEHLLKAWDHGCEIPELWHYGKIHHFQRENPLFLWSFSIANC